MVYFTYSAMLYTVFHTMHKHRQYCNLRLAMCRMADKFPLNSIAKSIDIGGVVNLSVGKIPV